VRAVRLTQANRARRQATGGGEQPALGQVVDQLVDGEADGVADVSDIECAMA